MNFPLINVRLATSEEYSERDQRDVGWEREAESGPEGCFALKAFAIPTALLRAAKSVFFPQNWVTFKLLPQFDFIFIFLLLVKTLLCCINCLF